MKEIKINKNPPNISDKELSKIADIFPECWETTTLANPPMILFINNNTIPNQMRLLAEVSNPFPRLIITIPENPKRITAVFLGRSLSFLIKI